MAQSMTMNLNVAESMRAAKEGAVKAPEHRASMPESAKRGPDASTRRPINGCVKAPARFAMEMQAESVVRDILRLYSQPGIENAITLGTPNAAQLLADRDIAAAM